MTISPLQPSYVSKTEFHKFAGDMYEFKDRMIVLADDFDAFQEVVANQFREVRSELSGIKLEIQGIQSDMHGMKSDIQGMKSDIQGMKSEIQGMKSEIQGMREDIGNILLVVRRLDSK